jgi:AraC-like DNA-binding protein
MYLRRFAQEMGLSPATVKRRLSRKQVIKRTRRTEKTEELRRKHQIHKYIKTHPRQSHSVRKLAKRFRLSKSTCHRIMKAGSRSVKRPRTTVTSTDERRRRIDFASALLKKPQKYRRSIAFSDEHWVSINDHSSPFTWINRGSKNAEKASRRRLKPVARKSRFNIPSLMIFGAFGINWRSPLIIMKMPADPSTGKTRRIDSSRYVRSCLSPCVADLKSRGLVLMQDGARCHQSAQTLKYLARKGVQVLPQWPASSPDCNPIENVWHYLDEKISERNPQTIEQLASAAIASWNAIDTDVLNNFQRSFDKKLANVCDSAGH